MGNREAVHVVVDFRERCMHIKTLIPQSFISYCNRLALDRNLDMTNRDELEKFLLSKGLELDSSGIANLFIDDELEDSFLVDSVRGSLEVLKLLSFDVDTYNIEVNYFRTGVRIGNLTDEELFEAKIGGTLQ